MDSSIHSHTAPPYLISPGDQKLFAPPGSFNFSMAALAADPAALAGRILRNIRLQQHILAFDIRFQFNIQKRYKNYIQPD